MKQTTPGTLGHAIRMARHKRQMTCTDLARICGVSCATITTWEQNIYVPQGVRRERMRLCFPELADREEWHD